jgi:hypothetical protein
MAVGRRILIGGSIPSLSPTEGKFRVKGNSVRPAVLGVFLDPNAPRINEVGHFPPARHVPAGMAFFSLGRRVAITDNEFSSKPRFSGRNDVLQNSGFEGTTTGNDPV